LTKTFEMIKQRSRDSDRLLVRPKRACYLLDCGTTYLYELIAKGELTSFLDGRSRKITVDSIHQYIAKQLTTATENNAGLSAGRHDFQKLAKARSHGQTFERGQLCDSERTAVLAPRRRGRPRKIGGAP
jgi:excisionase family DNA binding protein